MFVGMPLKKNVGRDAQASMNIILIVHRNLDDKDTSIKIIAQLLPGNVRLLLCLPCWGGGRGDQRCFFLVSLSVVDLWRNDSMLRTAYNCYLISQSCVACQQHAYMFLPDGCCTRQTKIGQCRYYTWHRHNIHTNTLFWSTFSPCPLAPYLHSPDSTPPLYHSDH